MKGRTVRRAARSHAATLRPRRAAALARVLGALPTGRTRAAARRPCRAAAFALVLLALLAGGAEAQPWRPGIRHPQGFLSGPRAGDPGEIAERFLRERHVPLGISEEDLDRWRLGDRVVSRHTGMTHLYLRQQLDGLDVRGGEATVNVMPDGRVLGVKHRFVRRLERAANARTPRIDPRAAVRAAAGALGLSLGRPLRVLERPGGPARRVVLSDGGVSLDPIPVSLVYLRRGEESMRLAWELFIRPPDEPHWWNVVVDAVDGEVLARVDWILSDSYTVFPLPLENPDGGVRSAAVDPSDATASPLGWHDDDGVPGPDHTTTEGNNVIAQEDIDGNNGTGVRANGGPALEFDFPLDLSAPAASARDAALSNLFYWNNVLHDVFYAYGFDEASGNFQNDNYGRGGLGGDPVLADALDGSSLNNANFSRAVDGFPPRMQMFLFQYPGLVVSAPASIAQTLRGGTAAFGTPLNSTGVTGSVAQADPVDACSPLANAGEIAGQIALIDRGSCNFTVKVAHAQAAGATAAIVVNDVGDDLVTMGGTDPSVTLRSLFVGKTHGETIRSALGAGVTARLSSTVQRDADFDATIIAHEYGHGVSIRLTGGPADAGCLSQAQSAGMGEGWSDWFALALTAQPGQQGTDPRAIGAWVDGVGPGGLGIRNYRYTTDLAANPQTLSTIASTNQPHGVGEVWALALWEMYWLFVGHHGFDPDLQAGTGGNNLALQLVVDALKQQPCEPTFLDARDALFDADLAANGGANECLMWQAFAKRGMGEDAAVSSNPNSVAGAADGFSVPPGCEPACGNSLVDLGESCDEGDTTPGDGCSAQCRVESFVPLFGEAEGGSVTVVVEGQTITVTTSGGEPASWVRQALADAITADPMLSALGVTALVIDGEVVIDGELSQVSLDDPGLAAVPPPVAVPALGPPAIVLVIAGMALCRLAAAARCRRAAS